MTPFQDNPESPFIARVDCFFEDTKKESDKKRAMVDWYLRPKDCLQIRKSSRVAKFDEIFLYTGKALPRNIDAEAIIWKCFVYNFKHRGSVIDNDEHFFCRSQFDARAGNFPTLRFVEYFLYLTLRTITKDITI